jgi:O-antigen chain-terminating methyltransferase
VREFRRRAEMEMRRVPPVHANPLETGPDELESFLAAYARLHDSHNVVGQMPPSPHTFRARMGSHLVRAVQRMLFWYTPQIVRFQSDVASALSSAGRLFEMQLRQLAAQREEIQRLRAELNAVRASSNAPHRRSNGSAARVSEAPAASPLLDAFLFAACDSLRGPECETRQKLGIYLWTLRGLSVPPGPWLDLGCGRGEWLEIVCSAGERAQGVDSNPAAVAYCRDKGLNAVEREAGDSLRAAPSQSLAVITAFHLVEHLPPAELLALVREAARVLVPGGLLVLETPDPANLVVGSHRFWQDPTHCRPIPLLLLESILQYFGFTVAERLRLNPSPPEEQLPFGELEFVRRMNESLYGPQDYGIIGRR